MASRQQTVDLSQLLDRAIALHQSGNLAEAEPLYQQVLGAQADHVEAQHLFGVLRAQQGRHREALDLIAAALKAKPDYVEAMYNRGNIFTGLQRYDEALACYDQVLALSPRSAEVLLNRGNTLFELKRHEEALASYDAALAIAPGYPEALAGRGNALLELKRFAQALASYDAVLASGRVDAGAFNNRGNALKALKRYEEALASYDRALSLQPDFVDALTNRGTLLKELARYDEAIASYERARSIDTDNVDAFVGLSDIAVAVCDWDRADKISDEIRIRIRDGRPSVSPFSLINYCEDAELQLECARRYVKTLVPVQPAPIWNGTVYRHDRIRVAYLSADFRRHVMAYQLAELFEVHDRSRFEVIGVSFGPDDKSEIRSRIVGAFDRFLDVRAAGDRAAAKLLGDLEVDIAVDLMGHSSEGRIGIFAYRPAPIQVNYLGYPGTTGAAFMDYVLADPVTLPFDRQPFYTEKIVHLPDCYQVNDSKRAISGRVPTRAEAGLPQDGFVFCCFNNNYKIARPVFDVWMRLLDKVNGSVLWLFVPNEWAKAALRREAVACGVDPARIVFADKLSIEHHLARQTIADLFLDTLPYNAHGTGSGALWAGLPILTCRGASLAGRVGASMLCAAGLPELVTDNLSDYETLALKLATDAALRDSIRHKLKENRGVCPLFDTDRFRRHVETAYIIMWETWQRGERPQSFGVSPPGG